MKHFILLQVILVLIFNLTYGFTISTLLQLAENFCVFTGKFFYSVKKISDMSQNYVRNHYRAHGLLNSNHKTTHTMISESRKYFNKYLL